MFYSTHNTPRPSGPIRRKNMSGNEIGCTRVKTNPKRNRLGRKFGKPEG